MSKEILYPEASDRNRLGVTRYGTAWGNGSSKGEAAEHRQNLREDAQYRQTERNKRTDQEQLDLLISRGHGHCDEAEYLVEKINGLIS